MSSWGWYAVNAPHYLGPFRTREQADKVARRYFPDRAAPGKRMGTVERLDADAVKPTFGLRGPLEPRYALTHLAKE